MERKRNMKTETFYLGKPKTVRTSKVHVGDVYQITTNIIDMDRRYLKPGKLITYDSAYDVFIPLIDSAYQITGEFLITSVTKNRKHWWQFWKSNKIKDVMIKCIRL